MEQTQTEELWGILELFGHQRIAGKISEYNLGGTFVRVDVPAVNDRPAFTKLFGHSAVYAVSFTDKEIALAAAEKMQLTPVSKYDVGSLRTEIVRDRIEHANSHEQDMF